MIQYQQCDTKIKNNKTNARINYNKDNKHHILSS